MYKLCKPLGALAALFVCVAVGRPADEDEAIVAREDAVEVMLLRHAAVQRDLKINPDDAKKIDEFATRQWRKVRDMRGLGEDERNRRFEAMARENEKFLGDTLAPDQRKRLAQIAMQRAGLLWALRPDVAAELKLTDAQKQQLDKAHKEAEKEVREAFRSAGPKGIGEEKARELRMANRERLMSVLTDAQKARWKAMAGPMFTGQLDSSPRPGK